MEYVLQQVNVHAGRQELRLSTVKHRKLSWFGHVCGHDTLPTVIQQGTVDCRRHRGRLRKSPEANIKEWACRHYCTLQTIEVDGQSSHQMHWSEYSQQRLGVTSICLLVMGLNYQTFYCIVIGVCGQCLAS